MSDLPTAEPLPDVRALTVSADTSRTHARATVRGLRPGWYRTADLWPRYEALATREGWEMTSRNAFGMALAELSEDRRMVHGHSRAFLLPESVVQAEA